MSKRRIATPKPNGETPTIPPEVIQRFRVHPTQLVHPNVAIVGFTDHRKLAFSLGPDWEVWGLNELYRYEEVASFHRWFEIHRRADIEAGDPDHFKKLATFDIPVYMHEHFPDIPCSVPFPKDVVEGVAGGYMTSSPAWMLGLAITMGAAKIHLSGIDMAQETEYFEQRNCLEYLIGYARGLGIEVIVSPMSDLLKAVGQYGFDEQGSGFRAKLKDRLAWLHRQDNDWLAQLRSLDQQYATAKTGMDNEYQQKREQLLCNRFQVAGAISDVEYILRSFTISGDAVPGQAAPAPDRSKDQRTGILTKPQTAASGDSLATEPAPVRVSAPSAPAPAQTQQVEVAHG